MRHDSILDTVGNTPRVKLNALATLGYLAALAAASVVVALKDREA